VPCVLDEVRVGVLTMTGSEITAGLFAPGESRSERSAARCLSGLWGVRPLRAEDEEKDSRDYGKENDYKGVFVAGLGGRPVSPALPYGELGGSLALYEVGNLPVPQPAYQPEVDPLRRFPEGVDVSPVERPTMK
jgi:hypothetical protein